MKEVKTTSEEVDEKYMIRKKFFIPKDEHTRFYGKKGDKKPCDFFVEEIKEDESEWH